MSRTPYTIERFDKGIICAAEGEELPLDSSPWSVDQDCEPPIGILRGRNEDEIVVNHASRGNNAQAIGWIVREDGKRDFLHYDSVNGKVKSITDFFGSKAYADQVTMSASLQVSIESINRSARIGWGNNAVKYVGYIDHAQFGGSVPSGLQSIDSKLSNFNFLPKPYKVVGTGTYGYGIEFQGKKIFKITLATGAFTLSNETFSSLQGIALYDDTTDYIYVYDAGAGTYGTLYKLDTDLNISVTYPLSGFGSIGTSYGPTGVDTLVSDIEFSADQTYLYFGGHKVDGTAFASGSGVTIKTIYRVQMSSLSANTSFYPTNCSPYVNGTVSGTQQGTLIDTVTTSYILPKRCLVRLYNGAEIGVLMNFGTNEIWENAAANVSSDGGMCIFVMNTSFVENNYLKNANANLVKLDGTTTFDSVIYMIGSTSGSNEYDILLATYGTTIKAYEAKGDSGDHYRMSLDGTDAADLLWDATSIKSFAVSATETLKDSIGQATLLFKDWSSSYYNYYVFNYQSNSVSRFYQYQVNNAASFSGATATYIKRSEAFFILTENNTPAGTMIPEDKRYYYRMVVRYQDSQGSPIYQNTMADSIVLGTGKTSCIVDVYLQASAVNIRVTGIDVFRAESVDTVVNPTTPYRMAQTIDLRNSWSADSSSVFGTWKSYRIYDTGNYGPSYEQEYGIPESLPNNYMRYSIATQGGGYLFVGQCYNEELENASNIIFRSKQNAPDTFDWSNDFLVLPTRPLALKYFKNILYAFDANVMYIIDPNSMTLLNAVEGAGVESPLAVTATEDLMFFGNKNNAFMHDGKTATVISGAVNVSEHSSIGGETLFPWRTLMASYSMSVAIHSKRNCVIFGFSKASTNIAFLVHHYPSHTWYYWTISSTFDETDVLRPSGAAPKMVFADQYGQAYLSCEGGIVRLNSAATYKACVWFSQQFNGGDVLSLKRFYKITLNGSTSSRYIAYDNSTTFSTSFTAGTYLTSFLTRRSIWMKLNLGTTDVVRGITVILRRMVGHR